MIICVLLIFLMHYKGIYMIFILSLQTSVWNSLVDDVHLLHPETSHFILSVLLITKLIC